MSNQVSEGQRARQPRRPITLVARAAAIGLAATLLMAASASGRTREESSRS